MSGRRLKLRREKKRFAGRDSLIRVVFKCGRICRLASQLRSRNLKTRLLCGGKQKQIKVTNSVQKVKQAKLRGVFSVFVGREGSEMKRDGKLSSSNINWHSNNKYNNYIVARRLIS